MSGDDGEDGGAKQRYQARIQDLAVQALVELDREGLFEPGRGDLMLFLEDVYEEQPAEDFRRIVADLNPPEVFERFLAFERKLAGVEPSLALKAIHGPWACSTGQPRPSREKAEAVSRSSTASVMALTKGFMGSSRRFGCDRAARPVRRALRRDRHQGDRSVEIELIADVRRFEAMDRSALD